MSNRYETLNVSLQAESKNRLNRTIQVVSNRQDDNQSKTDNDERVNKFKELYFKNEKLRKQLKLLNLKLNERLQKIKLPSVRKKAQSVDLNHVPPSKALQRELQNAYKQIAMYKKQVQVLKIKQQTPENYEKLRNMENEINFRDIEISQIQEQLKSLKSIKKMQQKSISADLENEDVKQRVDEYQREIKNHKNKIKQLQRSSRKREQEHKKQQAYLTALHSKLRKSHAEEKQDEIPEIKVEEVNDQQFKIIKQQIMASKQENEQLCKKMDQARKYIRLKKEERLILDEKFKQKDALLKNIQLKIQSYKRLLKDLQTKKYEQTGVKESNKMLKLEEIDDVDESHAQTALKQSNIQDVELSKVSISMKDMSNQQREWKGKSRKVSMGYMTSTDNLFQQSGKLLGLKVYLDENKYISGIVAILLSNNYRHESQVFGNATNIELKWQLQFQDEIVQIMGSFTEQGYLGEIVLISQNGLNAKFGNSNADSFHFKTQKGQIFTGIYGGLRKMGQDVRITEIGFWISKL